MNKQWEIFCITEDRKLQNNTFVQHALHIFRKILHEQFKKVLVKLLLLNAKAGLGKQDP
jgi:hypothetical protein